MPTVLKPSSLAWGLKLLTIWPRFHFHCQSPLYSPTASPQRHHMLSLHHALACVVPIARNIFSLLSSKLLLILRALIKSPFLPSLSLLAYSPHDPMEICPSFFH